MNRILTTRRRFLGAIAAMVAAPVAMFRRKQTFEVAAYVAPGRSDTEAMADAMARIAAIKFGEPRAFVKVLAALLVVAMASPAVAGRRCLRSGQSYASSHGWGQACYQCHKPKASAYNWREAITTIEKQKVETAAFLSALETVAGRPGASVSAYGGGGYSSVAGEFSSYPVGGQTLYGVNAYASHPLIDLNAAFQTQGKLAGQLQAAAQATAADTGDLASLAYQLESNRQTQIAAFSAIQAVAQGHPPQPQATQFRFNASVAPNGAVTIQPEAVPQSSGNPGLLVLENRCASCHSGASVAGKFDIATADRKMLDEALRRVQLSPDDPAFMPKAKGADGMIAGEPLTARERNDLEDFVWSVE